MPCGSCVDKLAYKLMSHHKIDMIRAYELAEKGIERHEASKVETLTKEDEERLGFDPDFQTTCNVSGLCWCQDGIYCVRATTCREWTSCQCGCTAVPKPHSHSVGNSCDHTMSGCTCVGAKCGGDCICGCSGNCYYSCDAGYVWNPATLTCDLIPIAVGVSVGNSVLIAVSMFVAWIHRRKKRRFIATVK